MHLSLRSLCVTHNQYVILCIDRPNLTCGNRNHFRCTLIRWENILVFFPQSPLLAIGLPVPHEKLLPHPTLIRVKCLASIRDVRHAYVRRLAGSCANLLR